MTFFTYFTLFVVASFLGAAGLVCAFKLVTDEPRIAAWLGVCAGVAWLAAR